MENGGLKQRILSYLLYSSLYPLMYVPCNFKEKYLIYKNGKTN